MIHPNDVGYMRTKLDQIRAAAEKDEEIQQHWASLDQLREQRCAEARRLLGEFWESYDLPAFSKASESWARSEGPFQTFSGFGQMWFNQVAKHGAENDQVAETLAESLKTPADIDDALAKFDAVESATRDLASKGQPAVARIPLALSIFWSTDPEDRRWPCMWPSAAEAMAGLGWMKSWSNLERYRTFFELAHALCPDDVHSFDRLMWYFAKRQPFVGLNPSLPDMCAEAGRLLQSHEPGPGYPDPQTSERAESLALQLRGELQTVMTGLLGDARDKTGIQVEKSKLQLKIGFDKDAPYRADGYATWSLPGGMVEPGLRLWATKSGLALGLYGGWDGTKADYQDRVDRIVPTLPDAATFFDIRPHRSGDRLAVAENYTSGEVFVGFRWDWNDVPTDASARKQILDAVKDLAPALRALSHPEEPTRPLEYEAMVADFRKRRPYPNDKDAWQEEERRRFADALSAENLSVFDLDLFRLVINGKRYGNPGPQAGLNTYLRDMDSIALDEFARRLREILWGEGDEAARIDRALDKDDLGVKGLGESVILKLFAITHPERFLPVFPLTGPMGKIAMLRRLGLEEPSETSNRGQQHVDANDALREFAARYLPGDAWGQGQFLYWLLQHSVDEAPGGSGLAQAAEKLMVPEDFLEEIHDLLQQKGQVIFYGPPGTGKTYIAQRLAEAIQPEKDRVRVVQFHPSMSYEDFFEGYRPRLDAGQLVYELREGPLAIMARRAEEAPGHPHFLIIDEINRANLPRVLGELLYLLEYRNKAVYTAYRPDEPFELPKNLYIIGTMNTADRSIAMMDAALRRRFHFVPFMPEEPALSSVLSDWLKKNGEAPWIAGLVDAVNEQLVSILKGPHLQVGHSHFMLPSKPDGRPVLTEERLERIWKYDVYPFIEDQLYGRPVQLEQFTWDRVFASYGPGSEVAEDAEAERVAEAAEDDESAH